MNISGSLLQAYIVCPRQAWLLARNICGDQYNEFLAIGKLLSEETYKKDKKEILIGNIKLDIVRGRGSAVTLIEVKKSSKMLEASKSQLLFYLYKLRYKSKNIKGEIRIPKEKKVIPVELTPDACDQIEVLIIKVKETILMDSSPEKKRIPPCKKCSYLEFCWA